ncbi:conserved unknown protein [Ectocarpus siliculosus]|uniref:Uncharacterized protein n=1 Tax=Ectocarpus siliculosus TaxID=2880 RepID=D7FXS1_ECTSI|nr:conserved unknown protein [Ectocarpus siliculosus]|eukprot:CBJ32334.1 conserved unknown protein [Ectocarpus siliculosus]
MEELLGLGAGDFEGVDFAASSDSDDEQVPNGIPDSPVDDPASPTSGPTENGMAAAPTDPASSTATTVVKPRDSTPVGDGPITGGGSPSAGESKEEAAVDAVRGAPLPEHAGEGPSAAAAAAAANLPLLRRVERCCLESRPAEVEAAVAALSSHVRGDASDGHSREGSAETADVCASKDDKAAARVCVEAMPPAVARAALDACRAALRLCRGEYEDLLRETALFSADGCTSDGGGGSRSIDACVRAFVVGGGGGSNSNTPLAEDEAHRRADAAATGAAGGGGDGRRGCPGAAAVWRAAEAAWAGAAALCLFLQENYAGPELGADRTEAICAWCADVLVGTYGGGGGGVGEEGAAGRGGGGGGGGVAQDLANIALTCDGELPYPQSSLPGSLVLARTILMAVAGTGTGRRNTPGHTAPTAASPEREAPVWSPDGFSFAVLPAAAGGSAVAAGGAGCGDSSEESFQEAVGSLSSAEWWSGRACVTHARLLISSSGRSETLWREARGLFGRAVSLFGGGAGPAVAGGGGGSGGAEVARRVSGQVWLEWGLAQHHFQDPSKGKESFARAKEASGLTAGLTGALGKRTKYQQSQIAQLVLVASSATPVGEDAGHETAPVAPPPPPAPPVPAGETTSAETPSGGDGEGGSTEAATAAGAGAIGAGPELGMSTAVGEEGRRAAARRTVHAEDSALLEDISFVQRDLENPGKLQDVDLAIILGLCLDVSNSNPRDGLTNEQMTPYIARVLRQPGCNWMIYSTALLQRAWVEFERSHARDRAALQLQALLDQHTTKLTYMQSAQSIVEDSAPVQDRLRFLCSLSFPPRWELRRDLARRYAAMGVLGSAAAEFLDLEMWEEAVECYRHMEQAHKAEKIARERLLEKETPGMLAALGDLTQDPECWQRAWDLSGGRYARAKASLARLRFGEGKYEEACGHYEEALAVKPLLTAAWFSLGVARMRLGRWQESLQAFSTVAQQEPEEGEAWGNMGAVHMHQGNWAGAAAAFTQGLKQMPSNWRMWENQAEALIRLGRWSSAAYACHRMLDLSDKSKRGVDAEFLALLVEGALKQEPLGSHTPSCMSGASSTSGEGATQTAPNGGGGVAGDGGGPAGTGGGDDLNGRPLCKQIAELLGRVVSATSTRGDARVWEVYARFNDGAGRDRSRVLDCVSKQCRALQRPGWEKDAAAVLRLATASDKLVQLYLEERAPA